jgi:hypothetical protein
MGIIKWWNDRKAKPKEAIEELQVFPKCPGCGANFGHFSDCTGPDTVQPPVFNNDADRVEYYHASGGKIVDLSNKPRIEGDGFPPDHELLTPFNRAHTGTKAGLNALMRGGKR